MAQWCEHCERDSAYQKGDGDPCPILGRSLAHDIDDPEYPSEWAYDENGQPCCTAFVPEGDPLPSQDDKTRDMFGE